MDWESLNWDTSYHVTGRQMQASEDLQTLNRDTASVSTESTLLVGFLFVLEVPLLL